MNFSFAEIALVLVVALLVIGPKKLPDMAKSIGKGYSEFKRAFNDLKKSVDVTGDMSGKRSSSQAGSAPSSSPAPKDTYKSRWEEQVIAIEEPAKVEAAAAAPVQEATAEPAQEPPARTKRADLVKEDEDGNNG